MNVTRCRSSQKRSVKSCLENKGNNNGKLWCVCADLLFSKLFPNFSWDFIFLAWRISCTDWWVLLWSKKVESHCDLPQMPVLSKNVTYLRCFSAVTASPLHCLQFVIGTGGTRNAKDLLVQKGYSGLFISFTTAACFSGNISETNILEIMKNKVATQLHSFFWKFKVCLFFCCV